MELAHRLARLEVDGTRLIDLATRDLDVVVPSCPDWTTDDLLGHVTQVWTAIAVNVETLPTDPISWSALPSWEPKEALRRLLEVMDGSDPTTPVWTWRDDDHTVGFYHRRAHQETLVHRVDAELAAGERTPVPPEDGVDGVAELFEVIVAATDKPTPDGSLHLHQTDGDGEFLLQVVDGRIVVRHEHAKGDAALRASGEDLLLTMWRRRSFDGLELFGDADVARQWATLAP